MTNDTSLGIRWRVAAAGVGIVMGLAGLAGVWAAEPDVAEAAAPNTRMVDPAIDETGPWCYLSKPNDQLAVPGLTKGAQFTYDGALYTGAAELCFFYGDPLKPLLARQKEMLEGWLPVYRYRWSEDGLEYALEAFATTLQDGATTGLLNFVRVRIFNPRQQPADAQFASALRFSGHDHRFDHMKPYPFSPDWAYEMTEDTVIRDGKLLLLYPRNCTREAVPGVEYDEVFSGQSQQVTDRAEVCLARFRKTIEPGESVELDYRMPLNPVPMQDTEQVQAIRAADHDRYLRRWVQWWRAKIDQGTRIEIPESKVMNAWRANLVHQMEAIWSAEDGQRVQGVNKFQYNWFWLRDSAFMLRACELLGHNPLAGELLGYFERFQDDSGTFASQKGQLDGFGQALFSFGQHYAITGDVEFAERVYPRVARAVEWLKNVRHKDEYGLLPPTTVRDNEFITGRYTGHNLWALLGLRHAIPLARATGHDADANDFQKEYDAYKAAFLKRLQTVCGTDGYIPPGLDVEGGQDWGNLLAVYPCEILDPHDPRITATIQKMQKEKYAEGLMTYKGQIHHYLSTNMTETHLARGEQEECLESFYSLLLHTSATHAGFEWQANPWGERDVDGNYPPHATFSGKFNALLRNMLVVERGGADNPPDRRLHLFSAVSPEWAKPGNIVAIRRAPTEFGLVTAQMQFLESGAEVALETTFRRPPREIVLHIPYFVRLRDYESDATMAALKPLGATALYFSPDVKKVTLRWDPLEGRPMSFEATVEAYRQEYKRRYDAYRAAGNEPVAVEAPPMLTAEERAMLFGAAEAPQEKGIAVGKPVTTNGDPEPGHLPEFAVDGDARDKDGSSWWVGPPAPRWIQIDLEKPQSIRAVRVFPYWDYSRYYRYTVEVSRDGETWQQVADMSRNTTAATPLGFLHEFEPTGARYVRVTMLYNSANPSLHLVEVRVFAAK